MWCLIVAAAVLVVFFGFSWAGGIVGAAIGFVILGVIYNLWEGRQDRLLLEDYQERIKPEPKCSFCGLPSMYSFGGFCKSCGTPKDQEHHDKFLAEMEEMRQRRLEEKYGPI